MSNELVDHFIDIIENQFTWSNFQEIDPNQHQNYLIGLEIVDSYRGHYEVLFEALRWFQEINSKPYQLAGASAVMMAASYIQGDSWEEYGLEFAQEIFKEVENLISVKVPEIEYLKIRLINFSGNKSKFAVNLVEELNQEFPENYRIASETLHFRYIQKDLRKYKIQAKKTFELTTNKNQQIHVLNMVAGAYLRFKLWKEAHETYNDLSKITPNDPWMWHNMSITAANMEMLEEAEICNMRALELMDFQNARDMQEGLIKLRKKLERKQTPMLSRIKGWLNLDEN